MLFLAAPPARGFVDFSLQMQLGNPSQALADTNNHTHFLVQRAAEALDYNDGLGQPNWASWDLTAGDVGSAPRSSTFFTDTNLPPNFYRVTDNDYNGVGTNGLNRGHLCPSEDRTDTRADNDAVFFMSNIMPQNGVNNSGVWGTFEGFCRAQLTTNELLILCGPSGFGTNRIPSGKAVIPDYVWKIAVLVPTNSGPALSRITRATRVIALKIPNNALATNTWPHYVTSASQIEVDTGLTFFTALPSTVADILRNKVDGQTNPPPAIFAFAPANGASGTNVVLTGANFSAATAVTFNGVPAAFTVNTNSQITATVPPNDSSGVISVTTPNGTAISSTSFIVNGSASVFAGTLVGWDVSGVANYGVSPLAPTTNAPHLTTTGLMRGSGIGTSGTGAANAWGGVNFTNATAALAVAANKFVTFSVLANAGYEVSFTSINRFDYRRSGTGPTTGVLQYQIGLGTFNDITNVNYASSSGAALGAIDLSGFPTLQNVGAGTNVTFRLVNYGGSGVSGSWYVSDMAGSPALDLTVQGNVTQVLTTNDAVVLAPTCSPPAFANNEIQFTLTGTPGAKYMIQAATNLAAPDWISLTTNAAPFVFVETNANLFSQRFDRGGVAP